MVNLSPTWVVINIGNRKYAINTVYVQSIVKLESSDFKDISRVNRFIKGVYDIHGMIVNILDGRRLINEKTMEEFKVEHAGFINNIRCKHEAWLDSVEWELLTGEHSEGTSDDALGEFIESFERNNPEDIQMIRLVQKMKQPYSIIHKLADKTLKERANGGGIIEATSIMHELRRQSESYILKNLDKLLELQTSKLSELCVIVKIRECIFGISIDSIDMITEQANNLSGYEKTRLSAGNVDIKGINYNILNLTKLSKVVK